MKIFIFWFEYNSAPVMCSSYLIILKLVCLTGKLHKLHRRFNLYKSIVCLSCCSRQGFL